MDNLEEHKNLFARLRELRRARGLTVSTLAEKMGENSQKVGRVERGRRSLTVDYLIKISKALETPMASLFPSENDKKEFLAPTDTLNCVIAAVEECSELLAHKPNSQRKAAIISKIYELSLKLPEEHRKDFLNSVLESLKLLINDSPI